MFSGLVPQRRWTATYARHVGLHSTSSVRLVEVGIGYRTSFDNTARIWDVRDGTCVRELLNHRDRVYTLSFSPRGRYVATGASDGRLLIHDLAVRVLLYHGSHSLNECLPCRPALFTSTFPVSRLTSSCFTSTNALDLLPVSIAQLRVLSLLPSLFLGPSDIPFQDGKPPLRMGLRLGRDLRDRMAKERSPARRLSGEPWCGRAGYEAVRARGPARVRVSLVLWNMIQTSASGDLLFSMYLRCSFLAIVVSKRSSVPMRTSENFVYLVPRCLITNHRTSGQCRIRNSWRCTASL